MTQTPRSPAPDPQNLTPRGGSSHPQPFKAPCAKREKRVLGDTLGLKRFGVNLTHLNPGNWSAQRHWHSTEYEFVYILEGEATLVTDSGEQQLGPGMVTGFPAGQAVGHHLVNRGDVPVLYLEVGDRNTDDACRYPDVDLFLEPVPEGHRFTNKQGEPY